MSNNIPKIKLKIEGKQLQAFHAIASEFKYCGKAAKIGLALNAKEVKNIKLNDSDFLCVYQAILRSMESNRYPNKSGNEYNSLKALKEYLEAEHMKQRKCEIQNL